MKKYKIKSFHKKIYHPTNALFFLYGNAPLEKELEFLNVLNGVREIKTTKIIYQKKKIYLILED